MIASTNLVFEIFLVIVTLLGWAFFGGEVVGGLVYILLGFVAMRFFVHKEAHDQARGHLHAESMPPGYCSRTNTRSRKSAT